MTPAGHSLDQAVEAKLTNADFQAMGATILGIAYGRWRKITMVVWKTTKAFTLKYPRLSDILYTKRLHLALKPAAAHQFVGQYESCLADKVHS